MEYIYLNCMKGKVITVRKQDEIHNLICKLLEVFEYKELEWRIHHHSIWATSLISTFGIPGEWLTQRATFFKKNGFKLVEYSRLPYLHFQLPVVSCGHIILISASVIILLSICVKSVSLFLLEGNPYCQGPPW